MSDIDKRFTSDIREKIVQAISDAHNNEVFFTGRLNGEGFVISVSIAARGNRTSVPVIQSALETADVLIHNHPSGNLTPSDADLEIAARVSESGLGFYIIDSNVTEIYVVVEPVLVREKHAIDSDAIAALLDDSGPLSYLTSGYEERPAQIQLTYSIANAFNSGSIGVFEAGTGVGKSFAYLLPAMAWTLENKDRVVISTGTINLQQQLIEKDIPMAEKIIGQSVKSVLLKGRQNYICKRRLAEAIQDSRQENDLFEEESDELEQIAHWAAVTNDGSRSDLSFLPTEPIWSRVCSESDACMGMRCSFHEECFVMKVRKEAASASLLIVNHHLLFADLEARMSGAGYDDTVVLPPFHHIIFDEAHAMEDAATSFFSEYFTRFKLLKQLSVLYRVRRNSVAGHLIALERLSSSGGEIQNALAAISNVKAAFSAVEDSALTLLNDSNSWRLSPATERNSGKILALLSELRSSLAEFVGLVRGIIDGIAEEDLDESVVWESKFALKRLEIIGLLCLHFTEWSERTGSVFWIEKKRISSRVSKSSKFSQGNDGETTWYPRFVQTPLSIAHMMKEGVFEPLRTVICTSATLRIAGRFEYWLKRTGVNLMEKERVITGSYDSPFPYKKNVLLAIPDDAPLPDSPNFQSWVETAIVSLLQASGGHSLVLFTSYDSLRSACEVSRLALSPFGITIFKQGDDDRSRLLEAFKADETSVLFATDSFWQGVDAPGDTLLQVILVKLPFRVPNDPVHAARSESITRTGGNAFMELSLPEAVVRFRQGFGRLMRKNSDRGVVAVLDRRLLAKKYGSLFLQSLPETATSFSPAASLYQKVEDWIYP